MRLVLITSMIVCNRYNPGCKARFEQKPPDLEALDAAVLTHRFADQRVLKHHGRHLHSGRTCTVKDCLKCARDPRKRSLQSDFVDSDALGCMVVAGVLRIPGRSDEAELVACGTARTSLIDSVSGMTRFSVSWLDY